MIDDGLALSHKLLVLSVLHMAVKDVRRHNSHARDALKFLRSSWCWHLAELVDVDADLGDLVAKLERLSPPLAG